MFLSLTHSGSYFPSLRVSNTNWSLESWSQTAYGLSQLYLQPFATFPYLRISPATKLPRIVITNEKGVKVRKLPDAIRVVLMEKLNFNLRLSALINFSLRLVVILALRWKLNGFSHPFRPRQSLQSTLLLTILKVEISSLHISLSLTRVYRNIFSYLCLIELII